tara:strand:- start:92 stop:1255 length:1164 start_codon:yes stop_codon:yes gene_type:complete
MGYSGQGGPGGNAGPGGGAYGAQGGGGDGYTPVGGGSAYGGGDEFELPAESQATAGSIRFNTDSKKLEVYILSPVGYGTTPNGIWMEVESWSPDLMTGGARGVFSGGNPATAVMDYITISSTGNAIEFDTLVEAKLSMGATSDRTRGIVVGGYIPSPAVNRDTIEQYTFASTGTRSDFEDLLFARRYCTGSSNGTRGLIAGGYTNAYVEEIEYVTIQSAAEAVDFGNLVTAATDRVAVCSQTRTVIAGGENASDKITNIEYVMTATLGNGASFGDLTVGRRGHGGACNSTRGLWMGGDNPGDTNHIDYVTMTSLGSAKDFGDLNSSKGRTQGHVSSPTRGICAGGFPNSNEIQYVQIMTKGNSVDFGNLTRNQSDETCGASNGHGGL